MFILDSVKLATRNFKTRKLRTFLTVLGISVGIATTLFLLSLGYGLQKVLLEKIVKSDALYTLDVTSPNPSVLKIDKNMIDKFSNIPNVMEVSPQQAVLAQFKLDGITSNIKLSGVSNSYFRLGGIELLYGEKYIDDNAAEVVLSTGALTSLGINDFPSALGKKVEVTLVIPKGDNSDNQELLAEKDTVPLNQEFAISGIFDDSSESSGYIPIGWTKGLAPDDFEEIKIKVADRANLNSVRSSILDEGFSVAALTDTVDEANKIFSVLQILLALFGIVALAVSAIGMFNTMTIALLERMREIGIMRAIGATRREILSLFLMESIIIGFLGGLTGVILGYLAAYLANAGFNFLAGALGGQPTEIFYTPLWFVVFIISFSTLIGVITGIYPSFRASRINPLEALRYK